MNTFWLFTAFWGFLALVLMGIFGLMAWDARHERVTAGVLLLLGVLTVMICASGWARSVQQFMQVKP